MSGSVKFEIVEIKVTAETREQIEFVARAEDKTFDEIAARLLSDEAEAQAGLLRGPMLRKHMYR